MKLRGVWFITRSDEVARRRDQLTHSQIHQGHYSIFEKLENRKIAKKKVCDILKLPHKRIGKT